MPISLSLSLHLFSFFWQVSHFRIWSSAPFALDLSSCCRRMSAGADPRASGKERDGLSTRHSVIHPRPSLLCWSQHHPGLHRGVVGDARGSPRGILAWRATREHRLDGRPGLATVDAAEGVENACWCIYAVNNKRACAYDASQEKYSCVASSDAIVL